MTHSTTIISDRLNELEGDPLSFRSALIHVILLANLHLLTEEEGLFVTKLALAHGRKLDSSVPIKQWVEDMKAEEAARKEVEKANAEAAGGWEDCADDLYGDWEDDSEEDDDAE